MTRPSWAARPGSGGRRPAGRCPRSRPPPARPPLRRPAPREPARRPPTHSPSNASGSQLISQAGPDRVWTSSTSTTCRDPAGSQRRLTGRPIAGRRPPVDAAQRVAGLEGPDAAEQGRVMDEALPRAPLADRGTSRSGVRHGQGPGRDDQARGKRPLIGQRIAIRYWLKTCRTRPRRKTKPPLRGRLLCPPASASPQRLCPPHAPGEPPRLFLFPHHCSISSGRVNFPELSFARSWALPRPSPSRARCGRARGRARSRKSTSPCWMIGLDQSAM